MGDQPDETRGDDTESMSLELWDIDTDTTTVVEQPPGLTNDVLFRPMISTFGDNSILFTGGSINNAEDHDGEIFQYTCDGTPSGTWEPKGMLDPVLESRQMYGIYSIKDDTPLKQKEILNVCKADRPSK